MKNLLVETEKEQNELIPKISDVKSPENLAEVNGFKFKADGFSADQYLRIYKNIADFKKERKRHQGDSTKIVLERHVANNVFQKLGGYTFVQKNKTRSGTIFYQLPISEETKDNLNFTNNIFECIIGFFFLYILLGLIFLGYAACFWPALNSKASYLHFLVPGIAITPFLVWGIIDHNKAVKKHREWKKMNMENQGLLQNIIDKDKKQSSFFSFHCKLTVELGLQKDDQYGGWYKDILKRAVGLAGDIEGELGWLCSNQALCQVASLKKELANYEYYFDLRMYSGKDDILPVIITKTSYIFYLPPHSDKMAFIDAANEAKIAGIFAQEKEAIFL